MDSKELVERLRCGAVYILWEGKRVPEINATNALCNIAADHIEDLTARVEALEAALEKADDKADGYQSEVESLVRAIAARKQGRRDVPSLYEWAARNWPTDWQLNGGNNNDAALGGEHANTT